MSLTSRRGDFPEKVQLVAALIPQLHRFIRAWR
jgi:hypothetical protein